MMSSNGIRLTQSLHSPIQTPDSDVIQPVTLRRIRSLELPSVGRPLQGKSNLRVKTQSESLMFQWRSSNLKTSRRLDWKDVHIRKYERTVGDNPSCRSGPPLSIDWKYDPQSDQLPIDEFEKQNPSRRNSAELLLSKKDREQLLMNEWDIPRKAIVAAVASAFKTQLQRSNTVTNMNNLPKVQEAIESAGRKCKRALFRQKRPSRQANEMIQQHLAAQAQSARNRSKVYVSPRLRQNDAAEVSEQGAECKPSVAGNDSAYGSPQATRIRDTIPDHVHQGDIQVDEQHDRPRSPRYEDSLKPRRQRKSVMGATKDKRKSKSSRSFHDHESHSTSCESGLDFSDHKNTEAMPLRKLPSEKKSGKKSKKSMKNSSNHSRNRSRPKHNDEVKVAQTVAKVQQRIPQTSSTPASVSGQPVQVSDHTHTQILDLEMQQKASMGRTTKKQSMEPNVRINVTVLNCEESHSSTSCDWGLDLHDKDAMESNERRHEKRKTKRKKRKKSSHDGSRSISEHDRDQRAVVDDVQNRSEINSPVPKLKRNALQNEQHLASTVGKTQEQEQPLNPNVDIESIGSYRRKHQGPIRSDSGLDSGDAMTGKLPNCKRSQKRKKSSYREKKIDLVTRQLLD